MLISDATNAAEKINTIVCAVVDKRTWQDWHDTIFGRNLPFEYQGKLYICDGSSSGPLDRFGYCPPEPLWALEVVPAEEWPHAKLNRYQAGIENHWRGMEIRCCHATKG